MRRFSTPIAVIALSSGLQLACSDEASQTSRGAEGASGSGGSSAGGHAGSASSDAGRAGSSGGTSGGASSSSGAGGLSTGGSAGSGGAGGVTAGAGGVAGQGGAATGTACQGSAYKLCEDFENGNVGELPPNWTEFQGYEDGSDTDVVLADDQPYTGSRSLKSSSQNRGARRAQRSLVDLGATAYQHWGRIFYRVDYPSPEPSTYFHTTFVSLVGPDGENRIVDSVEAPNGTHQWLFNIPSDDCCESSGYDWEFDDEWHCAEWWVDASAQSFRFFHDSEEVTDLAFTGRANSTMSEYTAIVVGATYYQSNGTIDSPFTIWFDDLAIHDDRIGCE